MKIFFHFLFAFSFQLDEFSILPYMKDQTINMQTTIGRQNYLTFLHGLAGVDALRVGVNVAQRHKTACFCLFTYPERLSALIINFECYIVRTDPHLRPRRSPLDDETVAFKSLLPIIFGTKRRLNGLSSDHTTQMLIKCRMHIVGIVTFREKIIYNFLPLFVDGTSRPLTVPSTLNGRSILFADLLREPLDALGKM